MKNQLPDKLPTLADEDIVTVGRDRAQRIIRTGKNVTVSLALMTTAAAVLPSCSDDKECSDSDRSTVAPYDTSDNDPSDAYADSTDYGQTLSSGDSVGNGDYCSDYD